MANIELVIKIPEDEYRWIVKSDKTVFANISSKECMLHAIKNGTPLPKGHGRLIDADRLLRKNLIDIYTDFGWESKISGLSVECAPTIIDADVAESEETE